MVYTLSSEGSATRLGGSNPLLGTKCFSFQICHATLDYSMKVHNPLRANYSHTYQNNECPFCNKETLSIQNIKALETKDWMILVNQYPILDGNIMLVTKRHIENSSDLTTEEWDAMHGLLERSKELLSKIFETSSFNIGFNIGEHSGSSVRHLHIQVIPRRSTQPASGFAGYIADIYTIKTSPQELREKILNNL